MTSCHRPALIAALALSAALLSLPVPGARAGSDDRETGRIVTAAEAMFQAMKARDYRAIWGALTKESRETIVADTLESYVASGGGMLSREGLADDFLRGGPVARQYWDGFLLRFDPDEALERSRWEMGKVGKDEAEIRITYRTADRPALLLLRKEGGAWKAGLVESFW